MLLNSAGIAFGKASGVEGFVEVFRRGPQLRLSGFHQKLEKFKLGGESATAHISTVLPATPKGTPTSKDYPNRKRVTFKRPD